MENYRKSAHCIFDIKYHVLWITKYRKPVLTGNVAERTRELIRNVCKENEVEILGGHVSKDHIHLLVSVPPHLSASKLVQYVKAIRQENYRWSIRKLTSNPGGNTYGREVFSWQAVEM